MFQVRPLGLRCIVHNISITTPVVRRLRLKKNYYRRRAFKVLWEFRCAFYILNHLRFQVAVLLLKQPQGGFRSEAVMT
jgi:hypothetical protein